MKSKYECSPLQDCAVFSESLTKGIGMKVIWKPASVSNYFMINLTANQNQTQPANIMQQI